MANKPIKAALVGKWISIEYEDKHGKARWYKGQVKKYDTNNDRYLIAWETGGQDWVDELKDDEYKMAKAKEAKPPPPPPAPVLPPKRKRSVKEAKILVYGLDGAGKSSIITKLASIADPPAPTHMFEVRRFNWQDVRLTVFDFGGREEFRRKVWPSYYDQADALVWVVDSTDKVHLQTCRDEMLGMLDYGVLDGVCLLVYANKLDLDMNQPLDVNEIADHLQFNNQENKILQERLWHIQSCSARTGDGLKDGMDWLIEKIKNPIQRDAEFYYQRAAEMRYLGGTNTSYGQSRLRDAEDDLQRALDLNGDHPGHQELLDEIQRVKGGKRGRHALVRR